MSTLTLTVPRDNVEMANHWQGFIVRELRRSGRIKFNAEDVLQYVMLKLCEANIVAKFLAGAGEQSHPLTVTADEAAKMLGITLPAFLSFQVESSDSLDPMDSRGQPVPNGEGYTSPKALYRFTDVVALSASVAFPEQGVQVFPPPKEPSVAQWKAYLTTAVRNHSSNYTRTHKRRASREYLADYFFEFRGREEGEAPVEFESRLVDDSAEATIEQTFNVVALLKQAPGLQTRTSNGGQTFFEMLQSGYTIREASKAVGLTRRECKVLAAHVGE